MAKYGFITLNELVLLTIVPPPVDAVPVDIATVDVPPETDADVPTSQIGVFAPGTLFADGGAGVLLYILL
jgi:hypothetical protein